ncbi:hypothetical protein BDQ17DRAFT_1327319 [Cyathus striatus]|nr:hypothetical protein BDQ17DRAFT_1327319 [Cyathus striatus]
MRATETCTCWHHCKGGKAVSYNTYCRHAPYRPSFELIAHLEKDRNVRVTVDYGCPLAKVGKGIGKMYLSFCMEKEKKNKEKNKECSKRWRERNKEAVRNWRLRYKEKNREKMREWQREYIREKRERERKIINVTSKETDRKILRGSVQKS